MATFRSLYQLREVWYDENDDYVREFDEELPHEKEILDDVCREWNGMHDMFLNMINQDCDDRIESCRMRPYREKSSKKIFLCVDFVARQGKQLTGRIKDAIHDFMDAQYCDGFGESIFNRRQTATDGTIYSIE